MKKLQECDFVTAAKLLNCEVAAIKAVAEVESRGDGFLPSGEPKILFERHIFRKYTGGAHDKTHPHLSNKTPGGYGKESAQHAKLQQAIKLNRDAALMACSWGRFQIMGFNFRIAGFQTLQQFINAMYDSETQHLFAFVNFVKANRLQDEIQRKDWAGFARIYNGPNYRANNYDGKMAAAYRKYKQNNL